MGCKFVLAMTALLVATSSPSQGVRVQIESSSDEVALQDSLHTVARQLTQVSSVTQGVLRTQMEIDRQRVDSIGDSRGCILPNAPGALSSVMECPVAEPDPEIEPLVGSLPLPMRLRMQAIMLRKTPSFVKMTCVYVRSQEERRALAVLSCLERCEDEKQGVAFMAFALPLSPSYMERLAVDFPRAMELDEFTFILAQGELTQEQLKGLYTPKSRDEIYQSRRDYVVSLCARLLGILE